MKKRYLVVLFVCVSIHLFSQPISFGPKVALNIIPVENDEEVYGRTFQLAPLGGVFGEIGIQKWFSVKAEVNYNIQKKFYENPVVKTQFFKTLSSGIAGEFVDTSMFNGLAAFMNDTVYSYSRGRVTLSYIQLPMMVNFHLYDFDIGIGGYVAYLLRTNMVEFSKQDIPFLKTFEPTFDSIPFSDIFLSFMFPKYYQPAVDNITDNGLFQQIDYGLVFDISYYLDNNVTLGLRYTKGYGNYRIVPLKDKDYNTSITISLTYGFGKTFRSSLKGIYNLDNKPVE